jgi:hypothetical protein
VRDDERDLSVCCIKGCESPALALGLCNKHWRRNRKYGSPVALRSYAALGRGLPPETRFRMCIKKRASGCWEWMAARDRDGYGVFKGEIDGILYKKAHRFSFALHNGPIPAGLQVCHHCDNPSCCNPEHLWLGTVRANQQDKWEKGRGRAANGEASGRAKLTKKQVARILADARPYSAIAADYGVTASTIGSIKQRVSWRTVPGEPVKAKRVSPRRGVSEKITPAIVREIRRSPESGRELARRFGVTPQTICDIRKRRSWAHVK